MSILIKGMEMPKRCMVCNFGDALMGKGFCYVSHCKQIEDYFVRNDRPSWCPLVELPPHGRLIDGDWLYRLVEADTEKALGHTSFKDRVLLNIRGCRTIIKSEGKDG